MVVALGWGNGQYVTSMSGTQALSVTTSDSSQADAFTLEMEAE